MNIPGSVIPAGYDLPFAKQSVGKGWHPLIEKLFQAKPEGIRVVQVKQKFNGLRFYFEQLEGVGENEVETFKNLVREAEAQSLTMCEKCGASKLQSRDTITHCGPCNR